MKKQKIYFGINICIYILLIIIIYILSYINRNYVTESNRFLKVPQNLKIVNLGSSHALYGIKYSENIKGFHSRQAKKFTKYLTVNILSFF